MSKSINLNKQPVYVMRKTGERVIPLFKHCEGNQYFGTEPGLDHKNRKVMVPKPVNGDYTLALLGGGLQRVKVSNIQQLLSK